MSAERDLYLVAYDVSDDARLRQALEAVRCFATGGQLSVHECWLTEAERDALFAQLVHLLEPMQDRLLFVRLDPRQKPVVMGRALPPEDPDWFFVG